MNLQIRSAECLGRLVSLFVRRKAHLDLSLLSKRPVGRGRTQPLAIAAILAPVFFGIVGVAK